MRFKSILFFITGILLLSTVVYIMTLWMIVAGDESLTLEQTKIAYHKLLPAFLGKRFVLEFFNISVLLVAGFFFYKCTKRNFLWIISWSLIIFCGILAYWNLFSLM